MKAYKTKLKQLSGSSYKEVHKKAEDHFKKIQIKTKRRPYVRSAYFKKNKIFLGLFWSHLYNKTNLKDKIRRLKLFPCAVELIQKSTFEPTSKENPNKKSEILHRFGGITGNNELFYVQIKEDKRSGEKFLISTFPYE
jgi:hypothetical protein